MPVAELAEARSTPRATESVEASEEAPPIKAPSPPTARSVAPSPSLIAEVRLAEDPTPVSVVVAASESGCRGGSLRGRGAKRRATDSSWRSSRQPASCAATSDGATPCTSKTPLVTVGAALFVRSLCLRCGVECAASACALCVWGGLRSASVP